MPEELPGEVVARSEEGDEQPRRARALRQQLAGRTRIRQSPEQVGEVPQRLVGVGRRGQLGDQRGAERLPVVERGAPFPGQPRQLLGAGVRLIEPELRERRRPLLGGGLGIRRGGRACVLAGRAAGRHPEQVLEAGLHPGAVQGQVALHRLRVRVPRAPREPLPLARLLGHGMRLPLGDHLDPVLEAAKHDVRLGQLVAVAAGEEAGIEQALERFERAPDPEIGVAAPVQELERLHEELDLADAAAAELQIDPRRPRRLLLRADLELAHLVDRLQIEVLAEDERSEPSQRFLAGLQVSRDRSRFQQGEALPGGPLRLVVQLEAADGVHDRAAAALRAQVQVDAKDEAAFRRHARRAHRGGHGLGQAGIEGEVVESARPLRAAVLVVQVEDVRIGGEVQLFAAQLAHPDHAETRRPARAAPRWGAVQSAEAAVVEPHRRLERAGGQAREVAGHLRNGSPGEVAQRDAQHLRLLVPAQPPGERARLAEVGDAQRSGPPGKAVGAEEIDEARPRGEELGEELRGRADPNQRGKGFARGRPTVSALAGRQRPDGAGERAVRIGALRAEAKQLRGRQAGLRRNAGRKTLRPLGVLPAGRRLRSTRSVHARSVAAGHELPRQTRVAMLISWCPEDVKRSLPRPSAPGWRCAPW